MARASNEPTNFASIFSIVIAILALIFAIVAWNNSRGYQGMDLGKVQTEIKREKLDVSLQDARRRLEIIRQDIADGVNPEDAQRDLADIRRDLQLAFIDAGEGFRQMGQELDAQLEIIEGQLRSGSVDVLNAIDIFLEKLKEEIQVD